MNATRFPLPPLPQPRYRFADTPAATRDLSGSTLRYVDDREAWQAALGEMVLLCKEAVRRRRQKTDDDGTTTNTTKPTASKPLSLEYLADRSDVDDPLWGYTVRDDRDGRLQGFVTVTTFTNYHKRFRWDSLHPAAFADDDDEGDHDDDDDDDEENDARRRRRPRRAVDATGRLARELQATVRAGDVWREGVVWPRVAEIGLLGGLGCGRTLLDLVLEDLAVGERRAPDARYDYVVLQATENSVSFYESAGFVRVGALTTESNAARAAAGGWASPRRRRARHQEEEDHDWGSPVKSSSPSSPAKSTTSDAEPSDWIVGPATERYAVRKAGDTPLQIARRLRLDALDVVFLNRRVFPDLTVHSRLRAETVLTLPKATMDDDDEHDDSARRRGRRHHPSSNEDVRWHTAKENDTPRSIARRYDVPCARVVAANRGRLPGLLSSSRLKRGTRIRITPSSHDDDDDGWQAYSHWAFPDDEFEEGEPSYMMALKLRRPQNDDKKKNNRRPVLESLAVPVTPFVRPAVSCDAVSTTTAPPPPAPVTDSLAAVPPPPPPVPPKRPPAAFLLFCHDARRRKAALLAGKDAGAAARILKDAYELTSDAERRVYADRATALRREYVRRRAAYDEELAAYHRTYPQMAVPSSNDAPMIHDHNTHTAAGAKPDLFNKVVRLRPDAPDADGGNLLEPYTYWYVLTYIPDLQWCHLAPMVAVGTFGPDKPKAEGRPKYKLEDEALGLEVDISSAFCVAVKAKSMRKTMDADREEWDVRDDGTAESGSRRTSRDGSAAPASPRSSSLEGSVVTSSSVRTAATKPSVVIKDRKRKRSSCDTSGSGGGAASARPPFLEAVLPDTQRVVRVKVLRRGPGRPPKNPVRSTVRSDNSAAATPAPVPEVLRADRSSSGGGAPSSSSSTSSTTTTLDTADAVVDDGPGSDASYGSSAISNPDDRSRPKRLSAPAFLGESPQRVRQQSVRGKNPAKY